MLPVRDRNRDRTARNMHVDCPAVLTVSTIPSAVGLWSGVYLFAATVLGVGS
jgi:hypothetical protein